MKRHALHLAAAIAAVFALGAVTPAFADDGCDHSKNCPKKSAKADEKVEKKSAKPAEKAAPADPAAPAAAPAAGDKKAEAPPKCQCEKGGKGCICKKGECKCANCGAAKFAAAGDEKPKCECGKGKECACKKGECHCKHPNHEAA
jgi:hypothetical protein